MIEETKQATMAMDALAHAMQEAGERIEQAIGDGQTCVIVVGDSFRLRVYNSAGGNHDAAIELLKRAAVALRGGR
jgi:class 3 adenylate cyclase